MIRTRDMLRLARRKAMTRGRWTVATLLTLSLGVLVFVAAASLATGLRTLFVSSMSLGSFEQPERVLRVLNRNHARTLPVGAKEEFIGRERISALESLPGVEAVAEDLHVWTVTLQGIEIDTFDGVTHVVGRADPFLALHAPAESLKRRGEVPIVIGELLLRSRFDPARGRFLLSREIEPARLIGTEVEILVGDSFVYPPPYAREWNDDGQIIRKRTPTEMVELKAAQVRSLATRYDMSLMRRALVLRGRVVGTYPGMRCLVPLDIARRMNRWIDLRGEIAGKEPTPRVARIPGPRTPPTKKGEVELTEVKVLLREGADAGAVCEAIRKLGLHPMTRDDTLAETLQPVSQAMVLTGRVLGVAAVLVMLVAALLIFLTTSRVVADSRSEIGLLRALGARRVEILRLYLLQSTGLAVLGSAAGIVGGHGLATLLAYLALDYAGRNSMVFESELYGMDILDMVPQGLVQFDPAVALQVLAFACAAGLLGGWIPARRAAELDPIEAMR